MTNVDPITLAEKFIGLSKKKNASKVESDLSNREDMQTSCEAPSVSVSDSVTDISDSREPTCQTCKDTGIELYVKHGETYATVCDCSESLEWSERSPLQERAKQISASGVPGIFANATYKGKSFSEVAPIQLLEWLESICITGNSKLSPFLFLAGSMGNGKTHMASDSIVTFIRRTGKTARYIQAEQLIDAKKDADFYGDRKNKSPKSSYDQMKKMVQFADLLVIDDIGRTKLTTWSSQVFDQYLDLRYRSGLPTILISNHTFDADTSLNGTPITSLVGDRATDRLKEALFITVLGPSKRGSSNTGESWLEITEEEKLNFRLPKSVLNQKEGELQILNWIARNPVFEPIADRDREQAIDASGKPLYIRNVPVDANRREIKVRENVWQRGDKLILSGPILGIDDATIYLRLLEVLKREHISNNRGLKLRIREIDLLRLCDIADNEDSRIAMRRTINRISSSPIRYSDNLGRGWNGPLFTSFFDPTGAGGVIYEITFNDSMITFYKTFEYTNLHSKLFAAKIGTDGLKMQMFLRSHAEKKFCGMDFKGWMRFLEKPVDEMFQPSPEGKKLLRNHRKYFSELIKKQINEGLLTEDSSLKRGNNVILEVKDFSDVVLKARKKRTILSEHENSMQA